MTPFRRMARIGGCALIAAGVIETFATIVDPDLVADIDAIASPWWISSHVAFAIAYALVLPGLVALYLHQAGRLGWLGEAGLVLALIGSALTISVSLLVGAALPLLEPHWPGLTRSLPFFEPDRPLHFMQPLVVLTALTYFPGFVMTGIATARDGAVSSWAGSCLVIGALGTLGALAGPGSIARLITVTGSVCLGVAFAWFGVALIAETSRARAAVS